MKDDLNEWSRTSYAQQGEDLVAFRLLRTRCNIGLSQRGFYVDIGAFHPVKDSNTMFLYKRGWSGICIDPQRACIEAFANIRPRDFAVQMAVSDTVGELMFAAPGDDVSVHASADPETIELLRARGMETYKVPANTADNIIEAYKPEGVDIDYINIDVEGLEGAVLSGLDLDRWKPKLISIEIHAPSIDHAMQSSSYQTLKKAGYVYAACTSITHFFYRRQG